MTFATDMVSVNLVLFVLGVAVLVKGSDWFVDAAAALARSFGVSELVIGLTLVSIGTSLPELASSLCAAWYGESTFIIGNIVGSNIANIALILGAGLVLGGSLGFSRAVVWRDLPVLLGAGGLLAGWFYWGWDVADAAHGLGRAGGLVLLALGALYTWRLCQDKNMTAESEAAAMVMSRKRAGLILLLALAMITVGAKVMVDTVVWTAARLGVSALVISLTVVAVGTSLPELAVTISGVLKKREDIALGNIIGSGIYNILLIIGCCATITPLSAADRGSLTAMILMNLTALLLWIFTLTGKKLYRSQGWLFLIGYAAFVAWSVFFCR